VAVCRRVIIESPNSTGATRRRPHQVNRPNDLLCCRARLRFTRKHLTPGSLRVPAVLDLHRCFDRPAGIWTGRQAC
jgi:hypothetical protein